MVLRMDASDVNCVWQGIYARQLASHGIGAGAISVRRRATWGCGRPDSAAQFHPRDLEG